MESTSYIQVTCIIRLRSVTPNKAIEEVRALMEDVKEPLDVFDSIEARRMSLSPKEIRRNQKVRHMIREKIRENKQ